MSHKCPFCLGQLNYIYINKYIQISITNYIYCHHDCTSRDVVKHIFIDPTISTYMFNKTTIQTKADDDHTKGNIPRQVHIFIT